MSGGKEHNIISIQVHGDALELLEPYELNNKITSSDLCWTQKLSVQHVSFPVFIQGFQVFCFVLAILELKGNSVKSPYSKIYFKLCYCFVFH